MFRRTSEYEIEDYTPEELQKAMELDRLIDQINGNEVESELAIDIETARRLSEARRILTEIKESYDDYVDNAKPPKEHMEETKGMLTQEMERLGVGRKEERRSLFRRVADGIQSAFSPQTIPQPAYRQEQVSDLTLHGQEMLKPKGYILRAHLEDQTTVRELTEGEYLLGASPQADIQLIDAKGYISRQHAKLILRDGGLFIVDLESTNGTFINGNRIPPNEEVKIELNDKVSLVDTVIEFEAVSNPL